MSSTFGQLIEGMVPVRIHSRDAARRSIREGDEVVVFNSLAEVGCRATLDSNLREGVAVLPKGLWCKHTRSGLTGNALAADSLSDLGGGATYCDARVESRREVE